jgi:hypothetical protein
MDKVKVKLIIIIITRNSYPLTSNGMAQFKIKFRTDGWYWF